MSTPHVVILHGYTATPADHWFAWLGSRLEAAGVHVTIPALPAPTEPDAAAWVGCARQAVGMVGPDTVVVGHSLGCITGLLAVQHEGSVPAPPLAGLVMVSGFVRRLESIPQTAGFTDMPLDLAALRSRTARRVAITSTDDDIVPPAYTRELAEHLDARLEVVEGGGHFLGRGGWTALPQAYRAVLECLPASAGSLPAAE